MSRFPVEYGDWNRYPARGGAQYFFPPTGWWAYPQNHADRVHAYIIFTLSTQANIVDGEYVTVRLNTNVFGVPSTRFGLAKPEKTFFFEFDKVPNGVTPGRIAVDISGDVTSTDVANSLIAAMNTAWTTAPLTAISAGGGSLFVRTPLIWADLQGNEFVADGSTSASNARVDAIRPAIFGAGPCRGWHRFDNKANQVTELPVQIGEIAY